MRLPPLSSSITCVEDAARTGPLRSYAISSPPVAIRPIDDTSRPTFSFVAERTVCGGRGRCGTASGTAVGMAARPASPTWHGTRPISPVRHAAICPVPPLRPKR
eukprot:362203-Chlamydomonas_euryale.AAC.14